MDVVNLAGVPGKILIQELLQRTHFKLAAAGVQVNGAGLAARIPLDGITAGGAPGLQSLQKGLGIGVHHHAVDGLKLLGIVMNVLQLHQGIAGGMIGQVLTGMVPLQLFIAALGSGQGVVTVANGKDQRRAGEVFVLLGAGGGIGGETVAEALGRFTGNQPAGDVAAVLHQVEVIELGQGILNGFHRLNQNLLIVVAQQQDMGQLDAGVPADSLAGRDPLGDGALGGADGRGGTGVVIIGIQVHGAHQTLTDRAVLERALDVDKGVGVLLEQAFL